MIQQEHARELAAERRHQHGIAMPGSAVDGDAIPIRPQHHALVAEQRHARLIDPQPGHRGLPGARLTREHIPPPGRVENAATMDLHTSALRQQMNHQQLVERVFERIHRIGRLPIEVATGQLDVAGGEGRVEPGGLVWDRAACTRSEREQEFAIRLEKLPRSAGIEENVATAFDGRVRPAGSNVYVGAAMTGAKRLESPVRGRRKPWIVRGDPERHVADRQECFVCGAGQDEVVHFMMTRRRGALPASREEGPLNPSRAAGRHDTAELQLDGLVQRC